MDATHTANLAYATACSLAQLAKTVPHVDNDRAYQLMQHAKTMLAPFGIQVMGYYDDALQEAIDRLMAMVPASTPRPV